MNLLISIIVLAFLIGGVYQLYCWLTKPLRKTEYDADFASASDVLSKRNQGFSFGNLSIDIQNSYRGAICYGSSGAGKNVSILLPCILKMAGPSNLVVHDPSGELWKLSSGYLKSIGYKIVVLNYLDGMLGGYNPLCGLGLNSVSEIQKICKLLIRTSLGQSKDPVLESECRKLLEGIDTNRANPPNRNEDYA